MFQPISLAEYETFMEAIVARNLMEKVKIASLLIRIPEKDMKDVER